MESQENANVSQQEMNVIMDSPKDEVEESQKYSDVSLEPVEVSASPESGTKKERSRKLWKDVSEETSHTKFFKRPRRLDEFKHVTREEYYSVSESMSGSADTFRCIHGPEGKQYTEKGLLKRNIKKNVDPMPFDKHRDQLERSNNQKHNVPNKSETAGDDHKWSDECPSTFKWDVALMLERMVLCPTVELQLERLQLHLRDFAKTSRKGIRVDTLHSFSVIINYLLESDHTALLREEIVMLLENTQKPLLIIKASDVISYIDVIANYISFMAYLLIRLHDDELFNIVSKAILFHLSAPDSTRGPGTVHLRHTMIAAGPVLTQTISRMVAVADDNRFRTFLEITLLLACNSKDNCLEMMQENIIEIIFYRFNPYFPDKTLPYYDINPHDCQDANLKLDVMSLSVLTELPLRKDWTATVNFTTSQQDVQFKKKLIHLVVFLLKVFPYNKFMIESRHWMQGLVYLLDPGLCVLRSHWSPALFAEIRKTALQALVCTIPLTDPKLVTKYGLIRRLMWYIEWYSESPYELPVLYWCVRLLQVATHHRQNPEREKAVQDLFDTHGIIILINLCNTLLDQKLPPVEKSQAILALSLRLLTSAVIANQRVTCVVYPTIRWPVSVNGLARRMMDAVLYSLDRNYIVSDRWLVSLLNFMWEAIVWRLNFREEFVADDGVYKLLDLITMTRPPVRCIALALVCDIARAGEAIGQLVSWRANTAASNANPKVVNRGDTIAALLASVFYQDCISSGVKLSEDGVIQDIDCPIMSIDCRNELFDSDEDCGMNQPTPSCLAAASLAGSSMSKAFAILHMLTEDLEHKVSLADESYNLYKNIKLSTKDEVILVLCSHYLTLKLNEVWKETQIKIVPLFVRDDNILKDFLNVGIGWAKEIKRQQEDVIANYRKSEREQESSLYAFLGRVRLNIALDALRSVRCVARSTERTSITTQLLHDAVFAHHRRSELANIDLLRTYVPALDDQNITGQNVKITSIRPKKEKEEKEQGYCSCSLGKNVVCVESCMHRKKRDS